MKNKHIIYSTILTLLVVVPFLVFQSKLPSVVPIHWDLQGNVNGSLSKNIFIYGTPGLMALINLMACYKYNKKFTNNVILYYIVPLVSFLIAFLMLYLALNN